MTIVMQPRVVTADEGTRTLAAIGGKIIFKMTGAETDGAFSLVEMRVPAGYPGPTLHIHRHTEEAFYILEGIVTFTVEGRAFDVEPGTFVRVPPGTPHTFTVPTTAPARFLVYFTPGGFEKYFVELIAAIEQSGGIPAPSVMQMLEAKYDTTEKY